MRRKKDGILTRTRESLVLIPSKKTCWEILSIFSKCQHLRLLRVQKIFDVTHTTTTPSSSHLSSPPLHRAPFSTTIELIIPLFALRHFICQEHDDRHLGVGEEEGAEEVGQVLEGYGASSGKYPWVFGVVVLLIAVTVLLLISSLPSQLSFVLPNFRVN